MADNLNTAAGCRLSLGTKTGADTEADYLSLIHI